jgi:hypothetical protein
MTGPFPNNVTLQLQTSLGAIDTLSEFDKGGVVTKACFTRPLRPTDPKQSIGIFPLESSTDESEIGTAIPTLMTYSWAIQTLTKHTDEQLGLVTASLVSKAVRSMLDRDPVLRVALGSLSDSSLGITERAQRWGVRQQRYANNEIDGQFVFLTTTDFWLQTETV